MFIKIYTKSQMTLLRKVNSLMGKYTIPIEILRKTEGLLYDKALGKNGFVAIFLKPLHNDVSEILDSLDCYPRKIQMTDELTGVDIHDTKSWNVKGKEWYLDKMTIKGEKSFVWVFYCMRTKDLYQE